MRMLAEQIMAGTEALPEGTPITAGSLLHLAERPAVSRALSQLARHGRLIRAGRGLYVRPVEGRFGLRPPAIDQVVRAVSDQRREVVASHGAAAANALGLTTQAPVRLIYLTDGPDRSLSLGAQTAEFRRAPAWQLLLADRPAGAAIRALAWLGPERAGSAITIVQRRLGASAFAELVAVSQRLPPWLARLVRRAA